MTERTLLARVALRTNPGSVTLGPFSFVVIPGTDDDIVFGEPYREGSACRHLGQLGAGVRNLAIMAK